MRDLHNDNEKVGVIVAAVFVALFLTALIVLCVCWYKNKKKR
jgi:hypothetical protein